MTLHARQRAHERYGLHLTAEDIEALQSDIGAGRAVRLANGGRRAEWLLGVRGIAAKVATVDGVIVTFLPRGHRPRRAR